MENYSENFVLNLKGDSQKDEEVVDLFALTIDLRRKDEEEDISCVFPLVTSSRGEMSPLSLQNYAGAYSHRGDKGMMDSISFGRPAEDGQRVVDLNGGLNFGKRRDFYDLGNFSSRPAIEDILEPSVLADLANNRGGFWPGRDVRGWLSQVLSLFF